MGKDSDEIRANIERTRRHMGDTVEALSYKTDVMSRARDWIREKSRSVRETAGRAGSAIANATPGPDDVKQVTRSALSRLTESRAGSSTSSPS